MELFVEVSNYVNQWLDVINTYFYSYILIALLIAAGLYFSVLCGFVQLRYLGEAIRLVKEKNTNEHAVSSFQALMISTASRVGIGNIAGVATAIALGGAGAVFWMWLIAIIGSASAFVESTLAQVYKVPDGNGFRGGPAYYIEKALGMRWLGVLFSVCLIACFAYGFNTLQANTIVSALSYYFGEDQNTHAGLGAILAALTAYVIFGGQKKIAFLTSVIVPLMAFIYLSLGLVVFVKNISEFPSVLQMIFSQAFDFEAIFGGFSGSAIMYGIKRGLFSNEAGMGSAPNAAAAAHVSHPVKQGLVQMLSVFIDTIIICSTSAFIILLSGVETAGLKAMPLVQKALYSQFGDIGILVVTISVFFFAFSSIIGNYYYTESNMFFIQKKQTSLVIFRSTAVLTVFLGSLASYDLAWNLADVLMGIMTIINIITILCLSSTAYKVLQDYQKQKKEGKNPVFLAKNIGLNNTDLWHGEPE
ncbi:alanine/glycine:cation symporter family protein [Desulfovibrio litoralis]|uniref:Alanine or glycine:cation symporter, AGCS family n=1 Tax=Desulfovibrio litoralis DSM 11393 TaxID=1121455 RepID=A0A1M7SWL2_9BACT|nr:alanine/glycine:cation symporter family protein [Desulfovibrio litoralis]SHN62840.1 alanine or glycine:cation symporter, AGCS family [Desulfovibrio litoralis DSM 11393]